MSSEHDRWRLLLDAVATLAADLSLDELLGRIVRIAADLSDARYAALGVLNESGPDRLSTFVTHGMSQAEIREVGDLPAGHGLLGLIIDYPQPLRLHDIAQHPASYGFPPHHPPMKTLLGVPLRIGDRVFGNLYLTEKRDGKDFTEQDEQIVVALAGAAGVAIENARHHEQAYRREAWLSATAEITSLLAGSAHESNALQVIADRARELSGADVAWVVAGEEDALAVQVVSGAPADPEAVAALDLRQSLARRVASSRTAVRIDDVASDTRLVDYVNELGWPRLGPAVMVPLSSRTDVTGVLALAWTPDRQSSYQQLDTELPTRFAEHAALALAIARSRHDEHRLAVLEDRDRIARDLHDVVIQRLFAAGLTLQSTIRGNIPTESAAKLDTVVDELDTTIRDIRRTIFALGVVEGGGADLQTEITHLVDRAAATMKFRPALSILGPIRTAVSKTIAPDLLAVVAELLSNAARHSGATSVAVSIEVGPQLTVTVEDNGRGLQGHVEESGLANVRTRAQRLGGTCTIASSPGVGTTVCWQVPLSAPSPA